MPKDNERLITINEAGGRLDHYLGRILCAAPVGFIYKMLRLKRIKLNGAKAEGREILKDGDILTFFISPDTMRLLRRGGNLPPSPLNRTRFDILYEDIHLLIINKEAGVLTHGGGLDADIAAYVGGDIRPAPVHRLDRNTSGALVFAKTLVAARELAGLRGAKKFYLAIVGGVLREPLTLRGFHNKDKAANVSRIETIGSGKEVVTIAEPLYTGAYRATMYTVLKVEIASGKSHQIRAHLSMAGYPIIGDMKYGDTALNRRLNINKQLLHAYQIIFRTIGGVLSYIDGVTVTAPPPEAFSAFLENIYGNL